MTDAWVPKPLFGEGTTAAPKVTAAQATEKPKYEPGAVFKGDGSSSNHHNIAPVSERVPQPLKVKKAEGPKALSIKPTHTVAPRTGPAPYVPGAMFPTIAKFKKELDFDVTDEMLKPYSLTREEAAMVRRIIKEVDLENTQKTLKFGKAAQETFSQNANDMVEVSQLSNIGVVDRLRKIKAAMDEANLQDAVKEGGFFKKLFNRDTPRERFTAACAIIDPLANALDTSMPELTTRIQIFEEVMAANAKNYSDFNAYVVAGELVLGHYKNVLLPSMKANKDSDELFASKEFQNVSTNISVMEKRLTDLKIAKISTTHSVPQIQMLKDNYVKLFDRISGTVLLQYPLWKKQYSTVLILLEAKQTNGLSDAMDALLKSQESIVGAIKEVL